MREAAIRNCIGVSLQGIAVLPESISDRHGVVNGIQVFSVTWRCFDEVPCLRYQPADDRTVGR